MTTEARHRLGPLPHRLLSSYGTGDAKCRDDRTRINSSGEPERLPKPSKRRERLIRIPRFSLIGCQRGKEINFMKKYSILVIVILSLCSSFSFSQNEKPPLDTILGENEMREATKIAVHHVREKLSEIKRAKREDYRVVGTRNLLQKGNDIWMVTFKPTGLIPKNPEKEMIGLGGEIFITVDLKTKKCVMTYGQ